MGILVPMYVDVVPNRRSPPAILLRESYREDGKVKKRTVANISHLPAEQIDGLRHVLKGGAIAAAPLEESVEIERSLPHGHVRAVLATLRRLGLDRLLAARRSRQRDLALALIASRLVHPRSKLATSRALGSETAQSSLGHELGVEDASEDELYAAMDWLLERQEHIETRLAERHLQEGSLVLYDLTSTYFEGRHCPLARLGHSRDGKKGKLQVVFGLTCNREGVPVAVKVFEGNTSDSKTVPDEVKLLRERFGLQRIVLVGDRGMITAARIREDLSPNDVDWVTTLRAPSIRKLVESGTLQLSLFDERDLAEIRSRDYPGERLIACRNPLLAEERARKRHELLEATERELEKIVVATLRKRAPLRGQDAIGLRVGKVLGRFKVGKHFQLEITDTSFGYSRDEEAIAAEAALDGLYVLRTSVSEEELERDQAVLAYKSLSQVERAFRSTKTVDLQVRPIHHRLADRVRAHVFLCMLAYHVEWHLRRSWAALLFDDDDREGATAQRASVVARAQRSPGALHKAKTKKSRAGEPIHSFQTLLADLATVTRNRVRPLVPGSKPFDLVTRPTPLQQRALELAGASSLV